jgi:hypothetical protein
VLRRPQSFLGNFDDFILKQMPGSSIHGRSKLRCVRTFLHVA